MSLISHLETLVPRWRAERAGLLPPRQASSVVEVFERLDQSPSMETVALYTFLGGMEMMDNLLWRMWSLEEIESASREKSEFGVLFADFLIDSHVYRLRQADRQHSEVWVEGFDLGPPVLIAKSLTEFFAAYCAKPDLVLHPPSRSPVD